MWVACTAIRRSASEMTCRSPSSVWAGKGRGVVHSSGWHSGSSGLCPTSPRPLRSKPESDPPSSAPKSGGPLALHHGVEDSVQLHLREVDVQHLRCIACARGDVVRARDGSTDTRMCGCADARMHGCTDARTHGCTDARMPPRMEDKGIPARPTRQSPTKTRQSTSCG